MGIQIAVLNRSTILSDDLVALAIPALDTQARRDLAPAWGIVTPSVTFYPKGSIPPANAWQVLLLDTSDEAGALGYHDVTPTGRPLSKVFAKDDAKYGLSWTVTTSHEICEMLVDPDCTRTCQIGRNAFAAKEVCDPCEADRFGYVISGTAVSDFVLPGYFQPRAHRPYDFMKRIAQPLGLLPGGYISVWTPRTGWTQKQAERVPGVTSRADTARRHLLRGGQFEGEIVASTAELEPEVNLLDLVET